MSTHDRCSVDSGDHESLRDIQARLRAEALAGQGTSHTHAHSSAEHVVRQPLLDLSREDYDDEKEGQRYYDDEDEDEEYKSAPGCCDLDDEKSYVSRTRGFVRSRNGAKFFAALLVLALAIFSSIYWILLPHLVDTEMRHGFVNPVKDGQESINTVGVSRGGEFQHGVVKIQDLDERFIPGGEHDPHGKRRLIFVGDIHGCKKELLNLLDKVGFDPDWDHFIATGDTINKGPHSAAVLDQLIEMNATTVRGNHEDRLIHTAKTVYDTFDSSPESSLPPLQDTDSLVDVTSASHRDAKTLKSLRARHLRYIQQMPLILRIRALPQAAKTSYRSSSPIAEPIIVVHAGLVPALPLEKQDPYYVTNMRSLHPKSHVPSADRAGKGGKKVGRHNKPWRTFWNWYNDRLYRHKSTKGFRKFESLEAPERTVLTSNDHEKRNLYDKSQGFISGVMNKVEGKVRDFAGRGKNDHKYDHDEKPQVVVYGHDARSGLQIKRWTKGMDSGCVGGGRLSALVLNAQGKGKVVSVGCHQYW